MICSKNCTLCPICHSAAVIAKGCAANIVCPGCNSLVSSWTVRCNQPTALQSGDIEDNIIQQEFTLKGPDSDKDPIRYYELREKHQNFALFAMTSFNKIDNCINTIGCLLNTDNCNGWGEEQVRAIEALGMNLHALMVTGDKEARKCGLIRWLIHQEMPLWTLLTVIALPYIVSFIVCQMESV
jgi:hypothetical protein